MILYEETKNMKQFYEKIDAALQTLVDRYKSYFDSIKKDRVFILNNLSRDLERISNLLDNYGYTYTPTDMGDISEGVFEVIIGRYLDGFQKFIDDGDSNLETLNVDIKNLLTIVDKHKNVSEHFI
jgi:hypothetical protein